MDKINKSTRPTSPHLTIYKPQISSMLSIGHRFSGMGVFFGLSIFAWWFICWVFNDFEPSYIDFLNNIFVKAILFLTSYGFFYHLCTGIRHLIWDLGIGFEIRSVDYSGWVAVAASIILTIIFFLSSARYFAI